MWLIKAIRRYSEREMKSWETYNKKPIFLNFNQLARYVLNKFSIAMYLSTKTTGRRIVIFFILFHQNSRRNCSATRSHCFCTNWYDLNYTLTEILPNIYLPHCNLSTGYSSWDKSSTVRPVNETLEAVTKVKHCSQHKQTCLIMILTSWSIIILGSSLLVSRTFFFHRVELMRMTKYPIRCTL